MTSSTTRKANGNTQNGSNCHLSDNVKEAIENYFKDLDGYDTTNLYELVMAQVERPLFEIVMKNTEGNRSRAAEVLGINRGTLRSRLKKYDLDK